MVIREFGGNDRLELADVDAPPVAPDGVLVRVRAAGLNPVDTKIREGYLAGASPRTSRSSWGGTRRASSSRSAPR